MARTGIRSRTGCFTCRQRKKKCNEEKPTCSGCKRNCLQCHWPSADSTRGRVKNQSKGRTGTVWRSLHRPTNANPEPTAQGASVSDDPALQRNNILAASSSPQHEAVTLSVSRTDSTSLAQRGRAFSQSPTGSLPAFITLDFASSQVPDPHGCFSTGTLREWDDDDGGNAFGLNGRDDSLTEAAPEVAASYSLSVASTGQESSASPPPRMIDSVATSSQPGTRLPIGDQGGNEVTPGNITPGVDEIVQEIAAAGSNNRAIDLTASDVFIPLDGTELDASVTESTTDTHISWSVAIPGRISLFPQQDPDAFHLLSFYLSRTANSMGNGSTDSNPFLSTLVPLAFSDQLVLQLLLAQSAVHRQVGQGYLTSDQVAQRYYTGSLRLFRSAIREYISGKSTDRLVLTIGSLILSLTEVARGDIDGNIFDHIIAAKSLLVELSADRAKSIPQDLMDFLIEYYTHMSVLSMISVDPQHCANPLLDTTIEKMARKLIDKKYIGQLCGCWLELLLTIPHIFDLGQRMRRPERPSPDDMIMFSLLQAQIMAFEPDSGVNEESRLAGLVFKQAVSLYLWSMLGCSQEGQADGLHSDLIQTAVTEGIALLEQIPATCRVNTSLCWPLTIIGCCTTEKSLQAILRTRLQTMFSCIGLGNMGETLRLLELVWAFPSDQRSPWVLCELMQEHQRWISFA